MTDLIGLQAAEYQNIVNTVDKFRTEILLHRVQRTRLQLLILRRSTLLALLSGGKTHGRRLGCPGPQVRGHNDDGVAEIHRAALTVGQSAVIQHLQQHIKHIRVRFFNLIQQDNAIRTAAYRLGQLATLIMANIPGRCTNQPCHGVFLHIFAHIQPHHSIITAKKCIGQRLGKLGFAHTRRPHKDERTNGALGIL